MAAPGTEGLHVSNQSAILRGEPREKLCSEDSVREKGRKKSGMDMHIQVCT